jgi:hypothetical protein
MAAMVLRPTARAAARSLLEVFGHTHGHVAGHGAGCPHCAARAGAATQAVGPPEYAFEVAASNIRYGRGVTRCVRDAHSGCRRARPGADLWAAGRLAWISATWVLAGCSS